jgi:hypothetical protein
VSLIGTPFVVLLAVLTSAVFAGIVAGWPRLPTVGMRGVAARLGGLVTVNLLVLATAATALNNQFLFFASWQDLAGAFGSAPRASTLTRGADPASALRHGVAGSAAPVAAVVPPLPAGSDPTRPLTFTVTGRRSGLVGTVVVHLPGGYTQAANQSVRYPVLEAFHGYPGEPLQWSKAMDLGHAIDGLVSARLLRPTLVVAPQLEFPAGVDTECVNGRPSNPQVETWLAEDVPAWVGQTFRVQGDRASWATIGLSAGGWCAAMATMLHPAQYAAGIVLGGYFHPDFGPLYDPYPPGDPLATRYDLVRLQHTAPPPVALWLETSHADQLSYSSSAAFLKAARPPTAVAATVLQRAGHRMSVWQGLLPTALAWLGRSVPGFAPR